MALSKAGSSHHAVISSVSWQRKVRDAVDSYVRRRNVTVTHVLDTGDHFYNEGVRDTADERFQTMFEGIYNTSALRDATWLLSLGGMGSSVFGPISYFDCVSLAITLTEKHKSHAKRKT
jgi:hypothetical protein